METIQVNRFKVYRTLRWSRSNYLWTPETNAYLKKYRIEVCDDTGGPADVLAIPCPHIPDKEIQVHRDAYLWLERTHYGEIDYQDTPMICDSSLDYAYLDPAMRELISHPQVRAYMTGVWFRDPTVQCRRSWGGEYYGAVFKERELHNKGPDIRAERNSLPAEVQAKIQPITRPPTRPFEDNVFEYIAQRAKPLKEREIDLFFSGRTKYAPAHIPNHPTLMRQRLEMIWDQLPGRKFLKTYDNFAGTRKNGQPIQSFKYPYDYVDQLLNSKVVISPWGWSAWCVRDLEALACGCLVIKPACTNALIYPDIYDPHQQFVTWCDLMYERLPDQLNYCYTHLDEMQERVDAGRRFVTDALYPNDKVYSRWTRDLRRILESALTEQSYARGHLIPN